MKRRNANAKTILLSLIFTLLPLKVHAETVAFWPFDEPAGCYPSTALTDNGPHDYTVILGRGAKIAEGRFGQGLEVCAPAPIQIVKPSGDGQTEFGLTPVPKPSGRSIDPMTWETAHFGALLTSGEKHLRHMEFANATDTQLNLGDFDWTVECWLRIHGGANAEGVILELGEGPRGENDRITRLSLDPLQGVFTVVNQPSGSTIAIGTDMTRICDGQWHHAVFVYDAKGKQLLHYLDGTMPSEPTPANIKALSHGDEAYLSIGRDGRWERPFPGALDEFRVSTGMVYRAPFVPPASFAQDRSRTRPPLKLHVGPPLLFAKDQTGSATLDLGSRKHLFLDDRFIAHSENASFTPNPPSAAQRVHENVNGHTTVIEDETGLLRLYYRGEHDCLAVLTSRDGLHWEAPDLGRAGASCKNAVSPDGYCYGSVFIDPNAPPEERWKYFSGRSGQSMFIFYSADGWNFTRDAAPKIPLSAGSQSIIFYDDQRQVYVGHHRSDYGQDAEGHTRRMFMLTEVKDPLGSWPFTPVTPERTREAARTLPIRNNVLDPWFLDNGPLMPTGLGIEYPVAFQPDPALDPPGTDVYVTKALKYPWAADAYLAFPTMFFHYESKNPARNVFGEGPYRRGDGPTECQLAVSRDGLEWRRLPRPAYIGIGKHDGKDLKMIYASHGLVRRGDEIWQYFLGKDDYHGSSAVPNSQWDLYRVVQRLDGFVSADTPYTGGRLLTKPFTFSGSRLRLNINTGAAGYAQAGFLDERGQPIPGFTLENCIYINGNHTDYEVEWLDKGKDVSSLMGKTVQLTIEMRGSKLYALQFQQE